MLLGIDIGTSSAKGVLVRADGTLVAQSVVEHEVSRPHPGWVEHDATRVWWHGFRRLVDELSVAADEPISAVGCSGIGPCLLPVDRHGQPLRPAILYGVDTRATAQIAAEQARYGDAVLQRCGSPLTTQAIGPKLAWLREHEPPVYARTTRWYMASSYLVVKLTDESLLGNHTAIQCMALYYSSA